MKGDLPKGLIEDVASLAAKNSVVLVHGGGDVVTEVATRMGKEQKFVVSPGGMRSRYTDKETAEIYQMVMTGVLGKKLVQALARAGSRAVSISGTDATLLQGKRKSRVIAVDDRGRKVAMDGGYTGKVQAVDPTLVDLLLGSGLVPVVSPVASSEEAEPLNIDGDRAAASLAAGIGADAVVFLTNVDGLTLEGGLAERLTPEEAETSLPQVGFGMQKKVLAAIEAVRAGVGEAIICSGTKPNPVSAALAHETCTVVTSG